MAKRKSVLKVGDFARIGGTNQVGKITAVNKGDAWDERFPKYQIAGVWVSGQRLTKLVVEKKTKKGNK